MSEIRSDVFEKCREINSLLNSGNEKDARNELIKLLDFLQENDIPYNSLVNHLIREVGLFPYFDEKQADWMDSFACEMFRADVGFEKSVILHREQSLVLKKLLAGENVAVSAPTSFGKSFIIDAYINLKQPKNVVILVPTIALMDETRRRLYKSFSRDYEIITQSDSIVGEKNIFVFPPERALTFSEIIQDIDIFIIDEFYKASVQFDPDRAPSLIKCLLQFSNKAEQRYFLAPNISALEDNPFTNGMSFVQTDYNTVCLNVKNYFPQITDAPEKKASVLFDILNKNPGKTLVYAGTFTEIAKLKDSYLSSGISRNTNDLLDSFSAWLSKNYQAVWYLADLAKRGIGMHTGRLHRSLAQIQVKLFEEKDGLNDLISTSSIIEGVNTEAKNVVIWKNKNGNRNLNFFTYKNIMGRSGRMFRHFVGNVFLLDKRPKEEDVQLSLKLPQDSIFDPALLDPSKFSAEEIEDATSTQREIENEIGIESFSSVKDDFYSSDVKKKSVKYIITDLKEKPNKWNGLGYLNSNNPSEWDFCLKNILYLMHSIGDRTAVEKVAAFIEILPWNWTKTIPEILDLLSEYDFSIDNFFELEKKVTYNFVQFFTLFNHLQKSILDSEVDISPFIAKMKTAFLPPVVLQMEEFGLPRMISRKIHNAGSINFEDKELTSKKVIEQFISIGQERICQINTLDSFDKYVVDFFYDGIYFK